MRIVQNSERNENEARLQSIISEQPKVISEQKEAEAALQLEKLQGNDLLRRRERRQPNGRLLTTAGPDLSYRQIGIIWHHVTDRMAAEHVSAAVSVVARAPRIGRLTSTDNLCFGGKHQARFSSASSFQRRPDYRHWGSC
jgi:hypothetical protein